MHKIIFVLFDNTQPKKLYPFAKKTSLLVKDIISQIEVIKVKLNDISGFIQKGKHHRQVNNCFQPVGVLSLWFRSLNHDILNDLSKKLKTVFDEVWYFEVNEKVVLNEREIDSDNSFTQFALISKCSGISEKSFFDHWHNIHTEVAINTQSTFSYIQNTISKSFQHSCPPFLAIVEESFPVEALENPMVFYNVNSHEALKINIQLMMESCQKFLNFEEIIVFPTQQLKLL